jgi:CHASE2 domain-containing sensor protein
MYWPWPREFYQPVTDYLDGAGAELIVYDILFDTPDFDRGNISGSLSDRRFMKSLKTAKTVFMLSSPQLLLIQSIRR